MRGKYVVLDTVDVVLDTVDVMLDTVDVILVCTVSLVSVALVTVTSLHLVSSSTKDAHSPDLGTTVTPAGNVWHTLCWIEKMKQAGSLAHNAAHSSAVTSGKRANFRLRSSFCHLVPACSV